MRRRFAMTLVCLVALTGCSDISAQLSGESEEPDGPAGTAGTAAEAAPALETVSWGVVDGMLSVLVRNPSDRTLRHATGALTARDAEGNAVGSSAASAKDGTCCTVADLPPGASYGFYFDVGVDAEQVAEVEVRYREVAWRPGTATPVPAPRVVPTQLTANSLGAVVVAEVAAAQAVPQAVAQAFLNGPDGEFLAVVSGRWSCFAAGTTRPIQMQLFHPLPAGTTVTSVVAYPLAEDARRPAPSCPA